MTGPSWFRLANAASRIRLTVRLGGALPPITVEDLARNLHARLDYPAIHGPTIHPNGFDMTTYRDLDIRPRNVIRALLRRWVRKRRAWRTTMRAAVLVHDMVLPDAILALPHVITWIAAFLG